ncbi:MAG TPA: hypothetical protein VGK67_27095 [Myxococcales bacterium]|jgi:hypothetical protein
MGVAIAWVVAGILSGTVGSGRVVLPEGWYQVEDGYGETEDSEILVIVEETQATPPQQPPQEPQIGPADASLGDEIALFRQPDCELVRGRYLQRLLELHGVNAFALDPRALAAWTHTRPPPEVAAYGFNGTLGDPAMAPLYGEPPIPPGALAYDLELQTLARDLLTCQNAPR